MTAAKTTVLCCDVQRCPEVIVARPRETDLELRRRASRENGWRFVILSSTTDLCRWHA